MIKRITSMLVSALLSFNMFSLPLLADTRTVTTSQNGDVIVTQTDKNKETSETRVQISLDTWKLAFDTNEPVLLQTEPLDGVRDPEDPVSIQITLPQSGPEILVGIPLATENAGTVAMIKNPSQLEPVQKSFVHDHILYVPLTQSRTLFILDGRKNFPDLKNDWQSEGVDFASSRKIMNGYENGTFGPEDELDRGMLIRMLYNLEGSEDIGEYRSEFPDVEGTYYTTAVHWAARERLLEGYSDGLFHAQDVLTREQIATILYRHAKVRMNERVLESSDSQKVSTYALPAVSWAQSKGLLSENAKDELDPQGSVSRGMAATIIKRYLSLLDSGEPLLPDQEMADSDDSSGSVPDLPGIAPGTYLTLRFESRGGTAIPVQIVLKGDLPQKVEDPELEGYSFEGWYSDAALQNPFDWNKSLDTDQILYARWVELENKHPAYNEDPDDSENTETDGSQDPAGDNPSNKPGEEPGQEEKPEDSKPGNENPKPGSNGSNSSNGNTAEDNSGSRPDGSLNGNTQKPGTNGSTSQGNSSSNGSGNGNASSNGSSSGNTSNGGNSSGNTSNEGSSSGNGNTSNNGSGSGGNSSGNGSNGGISSQTFTVSFKTNNGMKVESVKVKGGQKLNAFPILNKDGYELEGWYLDEAFTKPFSLQDSVTSNLTLHAKWKPLVVEYTYGLNSKGEKMLVAINGQFSSTQVKSLSQAKSVIEKVGQDFYGSDFDITQGTVIPDSGGYYKANNEVLYRYTPRNYRNQSIKAGVTVDKGQILLVTTSSGTVKALYSSYLGGTGPGVDTNKFITEEEAKEIAIKYLMDNLDSVFKDNEFDYLGDFTILKEQLLKLLSEPGAFDCELVLDPEARDDKEAAMTYKISLHKLPVRTFVNDGWVYMWYETPEENNKYNAFGIEWAEDLSLPFRQEDSFSYIYENLYSDKAGVTLISYLDPGVDYLGSEPEGVYDENTHSVQWKNSQEQNYYGKELKIDVRINDSYQDVWNPVAHALDKSTTDAKVDNRQVILDDDQEVNIARSEVTVIDRSEENPRKYEDQMIDIMKVFYVHADREVTEPKGEISQATANEMVYRVDDLAQKAQQEVPLPNKKTYRIEVKTKGKDTYLVDETRNITTNRAQVDALTGARTTIAGEVAKFDRDIKNSYLLHANLEQVYDYYLNNLNRKSFDGKGAALVASYDYSQYAGNKEYRNAMWIPAKKMFAFGSDYGTALDIVAHEYTHAVINYIVGGNSVNSTLSYSGESGSLNEAYADILGNLIEEGKPTSSVWRVGEQVVTDGSRQMETKPDKDYKTYVTSLTGADVHDYSKLFSHAAYKMMTDSATKSISSQKWFELFYNSLHYLSKDASMLEASMAVQMTAKNLGFSSAQIQAIQKAFKVTGIQSFN